MGNSYFPYRRQHVLGNGYPKVVYSSLEAAEETASLLGEKHGTIMDAYQCGVCNGFHIGNRRKPHDDTYFRGWWLHDELGDRVMGCMRSENHYSPQKRLTAVRKRWQSVAKKIRQKEMAM